MQAYVYEKGWILQGKINVILIRFKITQSALIHDPLENQESIRILSTFTTPLQTMATTCMDYALSYLSRYPKTEQEMRILLYKKWYTSEQVSATMESLKKNNFINDEKYAESYLYSEVVKKGKPVFVIKQKLQQRGVDKKLIDSLIDSMKDDMHEGIAKNIRKELDAYKKKGVEGFDSIQKLMRKGYRLQDIKEEIQRGK